VYSGNPENPGGHPISDTLNPAKTSYDTYTPNSEPYDPDGYPPMSARHSHSEVNDSPLESRGRRRRRESIAFSGAREGGNQQYGYGGTIREERDSSGSRNRAGDDLYQFRRRGQVCITVHVYGYDQFSLALFVRTRTSQATELGIGGCVIEPFKLLYHKNTYLIYIKCFRTPEKRSACHSNYKERFNCPVA
jgi:hypothetical protein